MIVIGPEEPLVNGLADYLKNESMFSDLIIIGPDKYGALLEGSKSYSKEFLKNTIYLQQIISLLIMTI